MILPQEFQKKMQKLLGEEYPAFLESYDREPRQALRVNTLKVSVEEFQNISPFKLRPVPWTREGFFFTLSNEVRPSRRDMYYGVLGKYTLSNEVRPSRRDMHYGIPGGCENTERPGKHPYHDAGLYYIQEPSAMAVGTLASAKPGERVLDLCAAPGGKTTHLAASMQGQGLLISNEIHPARARILASNVERMGIPNAIVTNESPESLAGRFPEFFDRIVVDAPCSGEGMFCKEEQALSQWSLENVSMCARRQQDILEEAAKMLRSGGSLVYSTCTFAPEENEGSISTFLRRHPEFSVKQVDACEAFCPGRPEWVDALPETSGTFRLWPHRLEGEGHYVAVLQKEGEAPCKETGWKLPRVERQVLQLYEDFVSENLKRRPEGIPALFGEQLYLLPCAIPLKGLKVFRAGLHLGTVKKNRFEPSHALALFLKKQDALRSVCLDSKSSEATAYLHGEALATDGERGWSLVLVDGYSLGWGKQTGGVLKNHYPKGLRWM